MATGSVQPFLVAGTVSIAATTTGASVASPITPPLSGVGGPTDVVVYNSGATVALIGFGLTGAAAIGNSNYPVPPGGRVILSVGNGAQFAAAVMVTGTGTVYFSFGSGSAF